MRRGILSLCLPALFLAAVLVPAVGQDSGDKATQALEAQTQSDAESAFFGDDSSMSETQAADKPSGLDQFLKSDQGARWSGSLKTDMGWNGGWVGGDQWSGLFDSSQNWRDGFTGDFEGKINLDARPAKEYRVKFALKTAWPFQSEVPGLPTSTGAPTTTEVPNLKLWELFADVNIKDAVFVRIGKQVSSWGLLGSAYSPSDVIALSPKDVTDLAAEREGPLALKVSVPANALNANFTGIILARDDYFVSEQTWRELGYAVKGEVLVKYTEIGLGAFYQSSTAPKLIGTLTSGLGYLDLPFVRDVNVFSESALSWGSDKNEGSGTSPMGGFISLDKPDSGLYYLGTLGARYSNSDLNYTISLEYFYNGLGSNEGDYARRAYTTLLSGQPLYGRTMTIGDALSPGMHNLTALLTLTDIAGGKFGSLTIWQQNLSDRSGWIREKLNYDPWNYVSFYAGVDVIYGGVGTEFPILNIDQSSGLSRRLSFFAGTTMGTGSF
ncbi:MAG TPA: hypothetical protein VMV83_01995 [Rectinemataceae bacterium]|nr:hypothetical protein [Rectinemataceae bacterium]